MPTADPEENSVPNTRHRSQPRSLRGLPFLLLAGASVTCLSISGCATAPADLAAYRQPAEFEPTETVWLGAEPDHPESMAITAEMIDALRPHVGVKLLLPDLEAIDQTRAQLAARAVDLDKVEFFASPLATFFIRDGAVYLTDGQGHLAVVDLRWSLYGLPGWMQRLYPDDPHSEALAADFIDPEQDKMEAWFAHHSHAAIYTSPLFLENATFEVNGRGLLLITEPLALERNPGRTREELEHLLLEIPGVRKVIWLAGGLAQDPLEMSTIEGPYVGLGAGGHTDEYVRFADPGTVLLAWVDDDRAGDHPVNRINHDTMQQNYNILTRATDQDGRPLRVVRVPMPSVVERPIVLADDDDETSQWQAANFPAAEGRKPGDSVIQVAASSYMNFLIANDLVLVPSFTEDGTPAEVQDRARGLLEDAFPGRTIRFIHATPLNWNGGGPHCATLSQPRTR